MRRAGNRSSSLVRLPGTFRKNEAANGEQGVHATPALEPPAPFRPWVGREHHPGRQPWMDAYLVDLANNGGHELACAAANVHQSDARAAIDGDPVLAEEVDAAHEYFCALTEWQSLNVGRVKGNPLPFFARLKADRPARYVERAQIQSVNVSVAMDASPTEAKKLLATLLGSATPTTRAELAAMGGLPALEEGSPDADAEERPAG